jgi:hypothetical protein
MNIIWTNSGRRFPRTPLAFPRTKYFTSSIDCLIGTFHITTLRPPLTRAEAVPSRLPRVITSRLKIYEHTLELCRCRWRRQLGFRNNNPLSWYSLNTNGKSFPVYSASVSARPVSQHSRYHISVENLSVSKPAQMSGLNCSIYQEAQWLRRSMRISTYPSPLWASVSFRRGRHRSLCCRRNRKRRRGNHRYSRAFARHCGPRRRRRRIAPPPDLLRPTAGRCSSAAPSAPACRLPPRSHSGLRVPRPQSWVRRHHPKIRRRASGSPRPSAFRRCA